MHTRFTAELYGYPLTAVAVWGAASGWRAKDVLSRTATAYIVAVLLFHALVPTSVEPRKIFQLAPVVVLFIIAGLDAIVRAFPAGWQPRAAVCAAAVLLYGLSGFATLVPFAPGFGAMADRLVSMPYTRRTATLISSNAYMRDGEAGIIAEWMQRDRSPGTYLVRGTKLLATLSNNPAANAPMYRPISEDPEQIRQILRSVPIATVILHTEDYPHSYPHHAILRHALERHPEEWDRIYEDRRAVRGRLHELIVYRRRHNVEGIPIRLTVDLTRKIGQSVSTPHDTARSQEEDRR